MRNDATKRTFEDDLRSALPEVILPSQFFDSVGARTFSSEQRLMLAVLIDAVNILGDCRASPNRRGRDYFNEASSWVFANGGLASPLSFDHVCDALGLDAESLRRRLSELLSEEAGALLRLRLKEAGRRKRPTANRGRRSRRRARPSRSGAAGGIGSCAERNQSSGASG